MSGAGEASDEAAYRTVTGWAQSWAQSWAQGWPALLAAPFVGSVCGVLIRRLPAGRPVFLARSACDSCGASLGPAELIPLASYAAQRGRCRRCGAPIGRFHPAVELAALALAAWAALVAPDSATLWATAALGWILLAAGWADWETLILPDALTLTLVAAGLGATAWLAPDDLAGNAAAAALAYAAIWALAALYRRLRGREGIGMGDAKLLAGAGAWVGLDGLSAVLLLAALLGLCLASVARLGGRREVDGATAVPFGSCLAAALWLVWLYDPSASGCCLAAFDAVQGF